MKRRGQAGKITMHRREFIRCASGLYVAAAVPIIGAAQCSPEQIDAVIKLIELGLVVAEKTVGYLQTRTQSTADAEKFVYECLYAASSSGEPTGSPIMEHESYVVTTPADGQWHSTDLRGFTLDNEGDFVVVAEGTGLYAVSDTVQVRAS